MRTFIWDTSAIVNIKELNRSGYSPALSLLKDLAEAWIPGTYLNLFPTLAVFEVSAALSRKAREGQSILRESYLLDEHSRLYDLDAAVLQRSRELFATA